MAAEAAAGDPDRLRELAGRVYRAAPDQFIEERDRLARELRDDDRALAKAVGALRKPTLPAWAVDQLALRDADELARLFELGDAARDALQGDPRAVRGAMSDLRGLVAELRERAGEYLDEIGAARGSHLDEVERTLTTAATDPGRRQEVAAGMLDRPLETSGFGAMAGLELPGTATDTDEEPLAAAATPAPAQDEGQPDRGTDDQSQPEEDRRRLEEERHRLERRREELRARRADARRRAEELTQQAAAARERADDLRDRAEEAEREAEDLRARAEDAASAADEPGAALADVEERLATIAGELDRT